MIDTATFRKALFPGLLSNIKISAEMKKLREHNTEVDYLYLDKNEKQVLTIKIYPKDYNS